MHPSKLIFGHTVLFPMMILLIFETDPQNPINVIAQASIAPASKQPILFENIGTMVASLSYLHTYVPLNLSAIEEQLDLYLTALLPDGNVHFPLLNVTKRREKDQVNYYTMAANTEVKLPTLTIKLWEEIVDVHLKEVDDLISDIRTLKSILPTVDHEDDIIQGQGKNFKHRNYHRPTRKEGTTPIPEYEEYPDYDSPSSTTTSTPKPRPTTPKPKTPFSIHTLWQPRPHMLGRRKRQAKSRQKRIAPLLIVAGLAAGSGVLGTSLGIYTSAQINNLWSELNSQKLSISRLITVADAHDVHLRELDSAIQDVARLLQSLFLYNPSLLTNRLFRIENQIRHRIMKATHLIQQAQHRRLPIDYLTDGDIKNLYSVLVKRSDALGCSLAIDKHSDLYQLETSYLYNGEIISLILHVPMYPKDSLLRLYKLHPFPLPFVEDRFLIPDVSHDIIGIAQFDSTYHMQLTATELLSCHSINKRYFCDRNGVLSKNEDSTCLGALYHSKYELAQKICNFYVEPVREFIYQLLDNWFIIYTPTALTIPTKCRNGTTKELFINKHISRFHLSAGCFAQFPKHRVFSDMSVNLPADFIQLEWEWDSVKSIFAESVSAHHIKPELEKLISFGVNRPKLSDLQNLLLQSGRSAWGLNFQTATCITVVGLLIILLVFMIVRCRAHRRHKQQKQKQATTATAPAMIPMVQFAAAPPQAYITQQQQPLLKAEGHHHNLSD